MTGHYFVNDFVDLHYYKFGNGSQKMLCFHGFGMHGKQFKALEGAFNDRYEYFGFDLFFHKQTRLKDQSVKKIKQGLNKKELAKMIEDFCEHEHIDRFSVIGYSSGTHYATAVVEELGNRVDEYIMLAPSSVNPGMLLRFFCKHKTGNKIIEKLAFSEKGLINLLRLLKAVRLVDDTGYNIILKEVNTPQLRFNLFACFVYLRFLETDESRLIDILTKQNIKSVFIFGKHDKMFPSSIGKDFFKQLKHAEVIVIDEGHEMINRNLIPVLSDVLL